MIAAEIYRVQQRYPKIDRMVIDHGGLGTTIMKDLQTTYNIPIYKAKKVDKGAAIRYVRDMLTGGRLRVRSKFCGELLEEWEVLPWNEDRNGHEEGYSDHRADGVLYNVREHPMTDIWAEEAPTVGSLAWAQQQAKDARDRAIARGRQRRG